jgi:hypothetical protein
MPGTERDAYATSTRRLARLPEGSAWLAGLGSDAAPLYGTQLPGIDDPRAQAVRRTTSGT